MKHLRGKTALITGAASGIGRALALNLAGHGVNLALADLDSAGLKETTSLIAGERGLARAFQVDVSRRQDMHDLAQTVIRDMGPVDILINNAGVSSSGRVRDLTYELLEWTININLWGVIHGVKAFLPHLLERPEAALVNISSVFGLMGIPGQSAYCTSKFAVRGFTEALRQELAGTSVFVTLVLPGGVKTRIVATSRSDYSIDPESAALVRKASEAGLKTLPQDAASAIIRGIRRRKPRVLIGRDARVMDLLARWMPAGYDRVIMSLIRKDPVWSRLHSQGED